MGEIIPTGAKNLQQNILEFNDPKEHRDQDGNYIVHNPGFLKSKTEDGNVYHVVLKSDSPENQEEEKNANNETLKEKHQKRRKIILKNQKNLLKLIDGIYHYQYKNFYIQIILNAM